MNLFKGVLVKSVCLMNVFFLCGCAEGVDYKKISNDLNDGNLAVIMNANADGYVNYELDSFTSSESIEEGNKVDKSKVTKSKLLREKITGSMLISEETGYGVVSKNYQEKMLRRVSENIGETKKESTTVISFDDKDLFYTNFEFNKGKYTCENKEKLFSVFFLKSIKGLQKVKPHSSSNGAFVPRDLFYKLNKKEFEDILNPIFHIKYDNFISATILFNFQIGVEPDSISEITCSIVYNKKDESNKEITFTDVYKIKLSSKEENLLAKNRFDEYKKRSQ